MSQVLVEPLREQQSQAPVPLGISNSVGVWCLQMRWIPMWAVPGLPFFQTLLHFVPEFPLDRDKCGSKILGWVGSQIPQLVAMFIY